MPPREGIPRKIFWSLDRVHMTMEENEIRIPVNTHKYRFPLRIKETWVERKDQQFATVNRSKMELFRAIL